MKEEIKRFTNQKVPHLQGMTQLVSRDQPRTNIKGLCQGHYKLEPKDAVTHGVN